MQGFSCFVLSIGLQGTQSSRLWQRPITPTKQDTR